MADGETQSELRFDIPNESPEAFHVALSGADGRRGARFFETAPQTMADLFAFLEPIVIIQPIRQ